ncbi:alpha/beta fold hydrolase [Streptomyces albireticuli]|uniref:alpha/beta fold hydrolase n=1 Tax=Streptomyces albireticuli TaxID=1940 RepID=UPI003692FE5D
MPVVEIEQAGGTTAVSYLVEGEGPGLLLVHGTGGTGESNWRPLIDAVRDRFTVVAPDLSGSGATTDAGGPLTAETLAEQAEAAAAHAGLERYAVVGHSLGATVAAAVAGRRPEAVTALVLHAGWVRSDAPMAFMTDLWARLMRTDPELFARLLQLTAMGPDTQRARTAADFEAAVAGFTTMLEPGILRQVDLDGRADVTALVARITAPTTVLASAHDQIIPTYHQRDLASRIPGARYVEVNAGHGLPFEDPQGFVDVVVEALGRSL